MRSRRARPVARRLRGSNGWNTPRRSGCRLLDRFRSPAMNSCVGTAPSPRSSRHRATAPLDEVSRVYGSHSGQTAGRRTAARRGRRTAARRAAQGAAGAPRPAAGRARGAGAAGGRLRPVHVVLGAAADAVRERADLAGCVVTTTRTGRRAWAPRCGRASPRCRDGTPDAALVSLVDQPGIGAAAVARVVAAYRARRLAGGGGVRRPARATRSCSAPTAGRASRASAVGRSRGARLSAGARGRAHARRVRRRGPGVRHRHAGGSDAP